MAKLQALGYELLDPGRYVLEVVEAEPVNEYGPQLRLKLRVAEGEHEGFEFTDYPNRGAGLSSPTTPTGAPRTA
jgi:hypothetical protein